MALRAAIDPAVTVVTSIEMVYGMATSKDVTSATLARSPDASG
jgi:hypothetical protein